MPEKYSYPDVNDTLADSLDGENGPQYQAYYVESRENITTMMQFLIREAVNPHTSTMLDAGGGVGRLIEPFSSFFSQFHFLEPDESRFNQAKIRARELGLDTDTFFYNTKLEIFSASTKFDLILLSHVIQHIPDDSIQNTLTNFHKMMKSSGSLFLTTSHSTSGVPYFDLTQYEGDEIKNKHIDKNSFNAAARNPHPGVVPSRMFTKSELSEILASTGFQVKFFYIYQIVYDAFLNLVTQYPNADPATIDEMANSHPQLQNSGTNLFVVATPKK